MASGQGMRDVELVEEDGADRAALPGREPPRPGLPVTPSPASRRPRRRAVGAVGALLLALAVGDVTADADARAGRVALASVPGVATTLDQPLVELWRSDPTLRRDLAAAGGHLVGVMGARGAGDVVGLDPGTGAVAWRTVVRPRGPGDGGGGVRCVVPRAAGSPSGADPPYVVCVVDRAARRGPGEAADAAPEDRLLTLDARTGAILADRTVARSTVLAALGPDVVTGHVDPDGYVHVARTDPLGEEVRWTFVTPHPLPRSHLSWAAQLEVEGDVVVVDEADGWVLSADGEVLHSWLGSRGAQLEGAGQVLRGGRYLVRPKVHGGPWPRSDVTDLRTGQSFVVPGRPLPSRPDDGTGGDRLVVRSNGSGGLVAHDSSGAPTWTIEGAVRGAAAVIDGRVLRMGQADLASIDVRTGHVVWSTTIGRPAHPSLVTDGRLVALTRLDPEAGVVLTAYRLDDGRERWSVDIADDIGPLAVVDGRVFGWTGDRLAALGVPPA